MHSSKKASNEHLIVCFLEFYVCIYSFIKIKMQTIFYEV